MAKNETAGTPATTATGSEEIEKARAEIAREREELERAKANHMADREDFKRDLARAEAELSQRAAQIAQDRAAGAGIVTTSGTAPTQQTPTAGSTSTLALDALAQERKRLPAVDVDALQDEYTETFRSSAFITRAKVFTGANRYIPPGTIIEAGTIPRSELEPLWQRKAIEPYVPPAPAAPRARPRVT